LLLFGPICAELNEFVVISLDSVYYGSWSLPLGLLSR